jgi:quercetin dioxygenase-like cupin family protein
LSVLEQRNTKIRMHNVSEFMDKYEGVFETDIGIVHHFSSGIYAKQMYLPKGFIALSHSHIFDHLSILAKGSVIVKTDTTTQEYKAPSCITIEKNTNHSIYAVEDVVWFCIHATDETDLSKIDKVLIQKKGV